MKILGITARGCIYVLHEVGNMYVGGRKNLNYL